MTNPMNCLELFFFSSRRRHTRWPRDWSSDVCSSDLVSVPVGAPSSLTEPITSTEPVGIGELPPPAANGVPASLNLLAQRSEERRVGKEGRARGSKETYEKRNKKRTMKWKQQSSVQRM